MGGVKHTAGPWELIEFGGPQIGNPETGEAICTMWGSRNDPKDPIEANARLIAAAPELLEALRLALEYFNSAQAQLSASGQVARDAARAAIAKATGETK